MRACMRLTTEGNYRANGTSMQLLGEPYAKPDLPYHHLANPNGLQCYGGVLELSTPSHQR